MANDKLGSLVNGATLVLICALGFTIRLFSVVKYESVIHEFDPYFNYRVTQFLTKEGFYNTWNWFDDRTWYPLGRVIGGTMFPGLTFTAGSLYKLLHFFNIPLDVQEVCVFTAPLFSAFCALAMYGLVREVRGNGPGLLAAAFVSCVPSYISRSVAGSFDNEAVAIFALVLVFFLFVKTLNTGSLSWATATSLAYLYMVMSWGAYTFIINLIPIHCLASIFTGRMNPRIYVAYAPLVVLGTLLSASIPVVGFNAVLMSEHFGAFFTFGILHTAMLISWIKTTLPDRHFRQAKAILISTGAVSLSVVGLAVVASVMASPTYGWTGRSLSLLDPTYASKYIPIIASVSEHQPPTWASYFMDIHILVILLPAGFICCFLPLTDASLFLLLYGLTSVYFSGVMVRLMLVLAPAACALAAMAISACLDYVGASAKAPSEGPAPPEEKTEERRRSSKASKKVTKKEKQQRSGLRMYVTTLESVLVMAAFAMLLGFYTVHSTWVSSEMYSAPSIVLQSRQRDGSVYVFDDFREAYSWMRHNTAEDSKIASWWDYGYQTTAMANRTVMVDNNTWNNTHIATIGLAMASPERKAWKIYRSLDVNYVFVVFGGYIGYPSDDINKFLWMVRIGGGEFPEIREPDYLNARGGYTVDASMGAALRDSLMYKLCYYRFAEAAQAAMGKYGYDRVRNTVIGKTDVRLKYFEEVFTSEHWMVRVYRVKEPHVRGPKRKNPLRKRYSSSETKLK